MHDNGLWPRGFKLRSHIPAGAGPDTPVLVSVHGISRNSSEHLDAFAAAAGEDCIVLAPHFSKRSFPNYQRLGIGREEYRADLVLDAALEHLARRSGLDLGRFHLFGFSGGAQFAHRYAMLNPGRIRSLHLAAAGWYTFPDNEVRWPRGLAGRGHSRLMAANLGRFARLPIHVYVGDRDTARDDSLRTGADIDSQQGSHRLGRAQAWVTALQSQAEPAVPHISLDLLPGADHHFGRACQSDQGGLAKRVLARVIRDEGSCVTRQATGRPGLAGPARPFFGHLAAGLRSPALFDHGRTIEA